MGKRYLTEEQKKHFREKRNATMLERYGVRSKTDVEKVKQTKLERYGDANYNNQAKHKETCLDKYHCEHHNQCPEIRERISQTKSLPETQAKYVETCMRKYGVPNANLAPEVRVKYTETLLSHYGVTSPLKNREIWEKHFNTMKENNSFRNSKPEDAFYEMLVLQYGEGDIEREYYCERYPFKCDFYIKSEDKFIELNYYPTHGTHPFDSNNPDDLALLEELKGRNTKWANTFIDVWTIRDVEKQRVARENNLNYIAIYCETNVEIISE